MDRIAPDGPVYQAGTLAGNPLAVAAGVATLEEPRRRRSIYNDVEARTQRLVSRLLEAAEKTGIDICVNTAGSMFTLFFTRGPVTDFDSACSADRERFALFFRAMLDEGVLFPPSQFEAAFLSAAHSDLDVEATAKAARKAFEAVAAEAKTSSVRR
jgi:glutamate-1-semialdehyde 2,1-aminomutase